MHIKPHQKKFRHRVGFGLMVAAALGMTVSGHATADTIGETNTGAPMESSGQPLGGNGFLSEGVIMIEFAYGPTNPLEHVAGIIWDGTYYWNNDAGHTPSLLNQYDGSGALITTLNADYDGRSLVQHPDGTVYASAYLANVNLGFAPYTQICFNVLPGSQSGHAVLSNGNIVARLDGTITEYTFPACALVNTVALNPPCPNCSGPYEYRFPVASDGEHLFVLSNVDEIWVYDYPSGDHIATVDLNDEGGFSPFSLSFDDSSPAAGGGGLLYIQAPDSGTIRGYAIHEGGPDVPSVSEQGRLIVVVLLLTASTAILLWRRRSAA